MEFLNKRKGIGFVPFNLKSWGGALATIVSIFEVLVAVLPWETGIVILPDVRETDNLSVTYSQSYVHFCLQSSHCCLYSILFLSLNGAMVSG